MVPKKAQLPFGQLLREHCECQGLSHEKLAELSGFDRSTISRFASGQRHPDSASVDVVADALKCSPQDRDIMRWSANYRPHDIAEFLGIDANMELVIEAVHDEGLPEDFRCAIRQGISSLAGSIVAMRRYRDEENSIDMSIHTAIRPYAVG